MNLKHLSTPMPLSLGMALVENPPALHKYTALEPAAKEQFIARSASLSTRSQMQSYVDRFLNHEIC